MMNSPKLVELYESVRRAPDRWQTLANAKSHEELIAEVQTQARAQGIILSWDEIATGVSNMGSLISQAAGDDALTDDELELVAAGSSDVGNKNRLNA